MKTKLYIVIIIALSSVWLILSADGVAARDWFVRPAGGNYGSENGSSYQNAWDGFANINWDVLGSGDTLYIAGTFTSADLEVNSGGNASADLQIRGDHPMGPGILSGAGLA